MRLLVIILRGEHIAKTGGTLPVMDEGRKRTLLIAASILAARKLSTLREQGIKNGSPAYVSTISDAIHDAEEILKRIDYNVSNAAPRRVV